ncbi:type II toxin-antitoxin system RelE/ParE family toxin [Rhodoplanes roseus]|uniref:Plasmid stabilization protein n=1 Tax=Rhodoplanes roseus TaxID=29409 RepID=A0A327KSD7_9BRAD|nr:type II toxin-antitoxin system RelE/ParE family toxin [Rhodoplanes roseus]RAI38288.1 plasmid stabilization protein [Rhodoplanes roseus]
MPARVLFSGAARNDLNDIFDWIAAHAGPDRAIAYVRRIERQCLDLQSFPERGTRRDDVRPGLRTIGFERRVTIAFTVRDGAVVVLRILYAGRSLDQAFL